MGHASIAKVNKLATIQSVSMSVKKQLVPIFKQYHDGLLSKWQFFKLVVAETFIILQELGVLQLLQHIIVAHICPGIGNIIVHMVNLMITEKVVDKVKQYIHNHLKEHQNNYQKEVRTPDQIIKSLLDIVNVKYHNPYTDNQRKEAMSHLQKFLKDIIDSYKKHTKDYKPPEHIKFFLTNYKIVFNVWPKLQKYFQPYEPILNQMKANIHL